MIKVMHVLTDTNIGGAGIWLINFLKAYDRQVLDVFVVLPPKSALCDRIKALDTEVVEAEGIGDKSFSVSGIKVLKRIIKERKPHVIHTHASLSARIAAKLCKVPVVHTRHCLEGKKSFPKNKIYGFINNFLSAHVIGISKAVVQNLKDDGINEKKLSLVYNGISPLKSYSPEEKQKARATLGIAEGSIAIGLVARLEEIKNPLLFARAAKIVTKKVPHAFFVIAGDGSLRQQVENEIKPIAHRVCMTGYIADIEKVYNALDILTLTSASEALSISLIEGMSLRVPVISTDSGGPTEIIENGKNGLIVPNHDEEALADAIMQLIENPVLREKFANEGQTVAKEKFTSDKMAQSIKQIYKKLAGGQIR